MNHNYQVLTVEQRSQLRLERVRALEADVCRTELAIEDALSGAERESLIIDLQALRARLKPHYEALGLPNEEKGQKKQGVDNPK